jgi:hypothetical protein
LHADTHRRPFPSGTLPDLHSTKDRFLVVLRREVVFREVVFREVVDRREVVLRREVRRLLNVLFFVVLRLVAILYINGIFKCYYQ